MLLNSPQKYANNPPEHSGSGGYCMKGSVYFRKDTGYWCISWYNQAIKRDVTISKYNGERMYHRKIADKVLHQMQGEVEAESRGQGVFRLEKWTGEQPTDVIPYLWDWLNAVAATLSPATYKDYTNSIKNHLEPFFKKHPVQLHKIQYDTLMLLLSEISRTGKGKQNVIYCLHTCLDYAWRSGRIIAVPPFPKKKAYNIIEPEIQWLPEARQMAIIAAIEPEHQPIFWWLKYHLRRPSEAMALHKKDFDGETFTIRRSFSHKQLIDRTKTGKVHHVPCHDDFSPFLDRMPKTFGPFFFENPYGHKRGRHYTNATMNVIWKRACQRVGEDIDLYSGVKHSSCSQYINEKGLSLSELQTITDHARADSVKRYAQVEIARKKELMNRKILPLDKSCRSFGGEKEIAESNKIK